MSKGGERIRAVVYQRFTVVVMLDEQRAEARGHHITFLLSRKSFEPFFVYKTQSIIICVYN